MSRKLTQYLEAPLVSYGRMRSLQFSLQKAALTGLWHLTGGGKIGEERLSRSTLETIYQSAERLIREDARNISEGLYPVSVLKPESPVAHLRRIPEILFDAARVGARRRKGRTVDLRGSVREVAEDFPRYYRRNFHFQTDGYFSEKSAHRYEHQVEVLFGGTADAMRRLIIPPMKKHFGKIEGRGLHFLELGAGTGRASHFIKQSFPRARITVTEISDAYLNFARRKLDGYSGVDFVRADAASLPFRDGTFDAVFSVFLFHELPEAERRRVIAESARVLRPGGFFGFVDSLQLGDVPEVEEALKQFPQDYHEPFYRNYIETPMEKLIEESPAPESAFSVITTRTGFMSKLCWTTLRAPENRQA